MFTASQPNCNTPIKNPGIRKPPVAPKVEVPTI